MPYFGQKKETDSGGVFHTWAASRLDSTNNATDLNGIAGLVIEPIASTFYIKALHVRGSSDSGVNPSAPVRVLVYDASVDVGSPNQARPPAAAAPLWTSPDFTFPAGLTETQVDITGLNVQIPVSGSVRPILVFDFDTPQAGEGAPRIANMEADYTGGNEGAERFTISSDAGATWGSGGAGVATVGWIDYEFTSGGGKNDQTGGVGDNTTTPARDNSGNVQIAGIGGASSSSIGVSTNQDQQEVIFSVTQTENHAFQYIGGGATNADGTPDIEVTHDAEVFTEGAYNGKTVRHVIANADAAPNAAISPSAYVNKTNPAETVENGNHVFGEEP